MVLGGRKGKREGKEHYKKKLLFLGLHERLGNYINRLLSKDGVPTSKVNQNDKPDYVPSNNYQYQYISRLGCSSNRFCRVRNQGKYVDPEDNSFRTRFVSKILIVVKSSCSVPLTSRVTIA